MRGEEGRELRELGVEVGIEGKVGGIWEFGGGSIG